MADDIVALIRRVAQEEGVDPDLAVAVARQESGLNPRAHNPRGEDSWGLFQLNRAGGMGSGYAPDQLVDPEFNARISLRAMAATQKRTGLTGGALAAASQRPADPNGYARSVNAMLGGGAGQAHQGSPFAPGGKGMYSPQGDQSVADTQSPARQAAQERLTEARRQVATWEATVSTAQSNLDEANARLERVRSSTPAELPEIKERNEAYSAWVKGGRRGPAPSTPMTLREQREFHQRAVDDAKADVATANTRVNDAQARLKDERNNVESAEKDLTKPLPASEQPKYRSGELKNFGTGTQPNWQQYNTDAGVWEPRPELNTAGAGNKVIEGPQGIYERQADGTWQQVVTYPEKPGEAALRAVQLETARANLATAQQKLAEATSPEAKEKARLEVDKARFDLEQAQQAAPVQQATREAQLEKIQLDVAATQRAQTKLAEFQTRIDAIRQMPNGPEKRAALDAFAREETAYSDPDKWLDNVRQEVTQGRQEARQQSDLTGTIYEYDPNTGQVQQRLDERGQPVLTASEQRYRQQEERARLAEERAQRTEQRQTEQAERAYELQVQQLEEGRRERAEREITARAGQRTQAIESAARGAGLGTGREVGTTETQGLRLTQLANAQGLDRQGVINLAQQMRVPAPILNSMLAGFDQFVGGQQQLREQAAQPIQRRPLGVGAPAPGTPAGLPPPLSPVSRAPVSAAPPPAPTATAPVSPAIGIVPGYERAVPQDVRELFEAQYPGRGAEQWETEHQRDLTDPGWRERVAAIVQGAGELEPVA